MSISAMSKVGRKAYPQDLWMRATFVPAHKGTKVLAVQQCCHPATLLQPACSVTNLALKRTFSHCLPVGELVRWESETATQLLYIKWPLELAEALITAHGVHQTAAPTRDLCNATPLKSVFHQGASISFNDTTTQTRPV